MMMAGPCAVESEDQLENIAETLVTAGVKIIRGGVFKARTSPYSFQGLGLNGLKIFSKIAKKNNLSIITEVLDIRDIEKMLPYCDIFQIGSRNMQNFALLREIGKLKKAVLIKRNMSSTIQELLLAAEYVLSNGNPNVILCERGIRTFETETKNTLSLSAIPLIKEISHLPIIVDPSHATGKKTLVPAMTKAAIAAGADGILIDIHPNPKKALCDGSQALKPGEFLQLMQKIKPIAWAIGRDI